MRAQSEEEVGFGDGIAATCRLPAVSGELLTLENWKRREFEKSWKRVDNVKRRV
jgi:hypothetical protein